MNDKINGATATSSPGPIHEFWAGYRYHSLAGVPFSLVLKVFSAPKVLQQDTKINISYFICFFPDTLKKTIADQKVKITTAERSICDAFKYLDEETAITSLRIYMMQDKKKINISKLMDTAEILKAKRVLEIMKERADAAGKEYPEMNRENFNAYVTWASAKRKSK